MVYLPEADLNAAGTEASAALAASWAGWAVSSLTSKFYRSKTPTAAKSDVPKDSLSDDKPKNLSSVSAPLTKSVSQESVESSVFGTIEEHSNASKTGNDWADGWDDIDDPVTGDSISGERKQSLKSVKGDTLEKKSKNANGWESEEAATWDSLSEKSSDMKPLSTPHATSMTAELGTSLASHAKQRTVNAVAERKKDTSNVPPKAPKTNKKGPMKLGAQKIS